MLALNRLPAAFCENEVVSGLKAQIGMPIDEVLFSRVS